MPVLFGVVTAPTLRYDGSIIQEPGYDERSRIFFEPNGVTFPTIPGRPTKEQALAALERLKAPIRGYQFDGAGRSVVLSNMITAVVRPALPAAPGHGLDAPVAGSGKTKLFDTASVLATGHRAAAIAACKGRNAAEEMYKQLAASVLAGDQTILFDNLEIVLDLPLLCQILTEQKVTIRRFGKLRNVVAACVALVGTTGNNLAIAGDNMRRFVVARIIVDVERPELREFDFDPVEEAKKHRPDLVVAALTVVRAYLISSERVKLPPLGSFERWSRWVREALVWLGEADPVDTMERVRRVDTAMMKRRQLMKVWPFATETSVAAVIARAKGRTMMTETDPATGKKIAVDAGPADPDLYAAVMAVAAGKDGEISGERLGWWLRNNKDQVVNVEGRGRCRFEQVGESRMGLTWMLVCLDEVPN
jgi:putative DNA primase/helicase